VCALGGVGNNHNTGASYAGDDERHRFLESA
jgi:hypothetical protein